MHLVNILRIITFSFLVGHSILTISDFNSFRVFLGHPVRWPDILPKDTLPKDILPKDILPNGHFADERFAEQTFCRTDILPNGHFAERTV